MSFWASIFLYFVSWRKKKLKGCLSLVPRGKIKFDFTINGEVGVSSCKAFNHFKARFSSFILLFRLKKKVVGSIDIPCGARKWRFELPRGHICTSG